MEKGLEINFCKDIKSYKKLIPALIKYPHDVLITADDDTYYPRNWFKELKTAYINDKTKIYCHRANEIMLDDEKKILPYKEWKFNIKKAQDKRYIFPTGLGGILYPPYSLNPTCTNENKYLTLAPDADDLWFWAMAKTNGTKHELVKNSCGKKLLAVDPLESANGLWKKNLIEGGNDKQLKAILEEFPEAMDSIV